MDFFEQLKMKLKNQNVRLVFPEATDERIIKACARLQAEHLIQPVLLGDKEEIEPIAYRCGVLIDEIEFINPKTYPRLEEMIDTLFTRRNGKITKEEARELVQDVNYFGTMLTYMGIVDGMVSGAIHSTGDTVRPALQIIKTKPGVKRTSGAFLLLRGRGDQERYLFSDCAINVDPDAPLLAEIAMETAKTAESLGIPPRVAMLSYSTNGSGSGPAVDKVKEALEIIKEKNQDPNAIFEGEIQFDAAYDKTVADLKYPDSKIAGKCTVFVFPELQSGNIGYKIAQRLGGFDAIGPILQGLNKPISDLSRGACTNDVYKVSLITAMQALMDKDEANDSEIKNR